MDSKLLRRLSKKSGTRLFSDGAHAWPAAVKEDGLKKVRSLKVSHKNLQFTKKFALKKKARYSNVAGTQVIDRWWQSLDEYVPQPIHNKTGKSGGINPLMYDYLFSFIWRSSLAASMNLKEEIGQICAM